MNLPRIRLLLVDDNPHDRGLVVRQLRQVFDDVDAHQVIDQREFCAALAEGNFDVVITDYQLRWATGLDVLKAVKERFPNCPVIMFTGTGTEEVAVEAMKGGLDDYVVKKIQHFSRLPVAVTSALEKISTRRRVEQLQGQLDSLINRLGLGVFRCTPEGELVESNAALRQLLGAKDPEDAADKWTRFLSAIGLSWAELVEQSSAVTPRELEVVWAPTTGTTGTRYLRVAVTRGDSASLTGMVEGAIEDVTARKKAESEQRALAIAADRYTLLTPREREVFDAVVAGHPNKVTARQLHITEKTVEKHRARIMKKLGARSVADLVRLDVALKSEGR